MFRSIFVSYGTHVMNYFAFVCLKDAGRRGNKLTAVHNKQVFYSRVTLQLLLRQTM